MSLNVCFISLTQASVNPWGCRYLMLDAPWVIAQGRQESVNSALVYFGLISECRLSGISCLAKSPSAAIPHWWYCFGQMVNVIARSSLKQPQDSMFSLGWGCLKDTSVRGMMEWVWLVLQCNVLGTGCVSNIGGGFLQWPYSYQAKTYIPLWVAMFW